MSEPSLLFGSPNCSLEIEQAILAYLINDVTHPEASTRFGTHFLAFPLLHVNRHLRQQVAKLLYKTVFQQERQTLSCDGARPIARERLLLLLAMPRFLPKPLERDDPRFVFYGNIKADINGHHDYVPRTNYAEYAATSLEVGSDALLVSFALDQGSLEENENSSKEWSISTRWRNDLQAISTAWFEDTQHAPLVSDGQRMDNLSEQEQDARRHAFQQRGLNRYGLKSTAPVVLKENRAYDIARPPLLNPLWGTRDDPGPHKEQDVALDGKFPMWMFTYMSEHVKEPPVTERCMRTQRTREKSMLEFQLIQVPLLELLRPPIARQSPYRQDTC